MKRISTPREKLLGKRKSKLQWDTASHLLEWILPTRQVTTRVGEVVEKKAPSFTAEGAVNWYSHHGNSMVAPRKFKNRGTLWPRNPYSGYLPEIWKHLLAKIYAHLCSLQQYSWWPRHANNQCPSTDDWAAKVWCRYTMERYSAIRKDELLPLWPYGWTLRITC